MVCTLETVASKIGTPKEIIFLTSPSRHNFTAREFDHLSAVSSLALSCTVHVALLGSESFDFCARNHTNISEPCYSNTLKSTYTSCLLKSTCNVLRSLNFRIIFSYLRGNRIGDKTEIEEPSWIKKATWPNSKFSVYFSSRLKVLDYTGLGSAKIRLLQI